MYKIKEALEQIIIDWHAKKSLQLPSIQIEPFNESDVEVHLLISARDFLIGITAVHSLLRFLPPISLSISHDGTLTAKQHDCLLQKFPGCRVLDRHALQESKTWTLQRPLLSNLYTSNYHPIVKLLHPILLSNHNRIILLDSDTLCLEEPHRILSWITQQESTGLYLHDPISRNKEATELPEVFANILNKDCKSFKMRLEHYFFNSGLLCYDRRECNLDVAEKFLKWRVDNANKFDFKNCDIWLGDWTPEQTAYMLIYEDSLLDVQGFGGDYALGYKDRWLTFHHFLRSGVKTRKVQKKIQETIKAML